MTLELSPTGQCVALLAEIVKIGRAGMCVATYDEDTWHCRYCAAEPQDRPNNFEHEPTCPIARARKLLNIKES